MSMGGRATNGNAKIVFRIAILLSEL